MEDSQITNKDYRKSLKEFEEGKIKIDRPPKYIYKIYDSLPSKYRDHPRFYREGDFYYIVTSPYLHGVKNIEIDPGWNEIPCIYYHCARSFVLRIAVGSRTFKIKENNDEIR